MSSTVQIRQGNARNRKAETFSALAIAKNGDATDIANAIPVSAGSGAPNHNARVAGEIYIRTDGTAAALDISEAANVYLRFVTTDGSEGVTIGKPVLFGGGLAPGSIFKSTEQTGTGSAQNVAHGLGTTPSLVWVTVTEDPGGTGFDVTEGSHGSTNCVVTVTTGVKYKVLAFK